MRARWHACTHTQTHRSDCSLRSTLTSAVISGAPAAHFLTTETSITGLHGEKVSGCLSVPLLRLPTGSDHVHTQCHTHRDTHTRKYIPQHPLNLQFNVKVFLSESIKCLESLCPSLCQSINPHTFSFNLGVTPVQRKIADPRWFLFHLTHSIYLWLMTSPPQGPLGPTLCTQPHMHLWSGTEISSLKQYPSIVLSPRAFASPSLMFAWGLTGVPASPRSLHVPWGEWCCYNCIFTSSHLPLAAFSLVCTGKY